MAKKRKASAKDSSSPPKKRTTTKKKKGGSSRATSSPKATSNDTLENFPIVGVGSSAGGLEAVIKLVESMGENPGFALVVIQHLDPTTESLFPEVLSHHTKLRVMQVNDDPLVKPNCIYVIPPAKYLSISQGELHLSEPKEPRGRRMAIDHFLRCLAEDQQQRAVAVILSGTGTDGTLGIKAIQRNGGLVIAQTPSTAQHSGMPQSAIASGVVDLTLAPEEIPEAILQFGQHPYVQNAQPNGQDHSDLDNEPTAGPIDDAESLQAILTLLRVRTRHDFRGYKDATLVRRTRRRMCLRHLDSYHDYLEYLRNHAEEADALVKDLLISVTDFFRDTAAWESLGKVVRNIVQHKSEDDSIRIWVPGCATGEEPYSLAMLFMEELQAAKKHCSLQLFATDIDRDAIERARAGKYSNSIVADVSADRLQRFFVRSDDGQAYCINKRLREAVVFAQQNLISDPPFSKLDFICCRNLLIYLKPDMQEKVIALFHYALKESGVLFLGNSETLGRHSGSFSVIDKRWRIYRRLAVARPHDVKIPIAPNLNLPNSPGTTPALPGNQPNWMAQLAQGHLLSLLGAAAVMVDTNLKIRYISGDVNAYLVRAPGIPSDNLLDNCRRGLRAKLRVIVQKAFKEGASLTSTQILEEQGKSQTVRMSVHPITSQEEHEALALILFETPAANDSATQAEKTGPEDGQLKSHQGNQPTQVEFNEQAVIRQLEEELTSAYSELKSTIEQLETSNEEFKASNEEVMSTNEEIQSTNEELETSKEELQSLNEELTTVNNQLSVKLVELEAKHSDLENLIYLTDVATICLDNKLRIRWFTPAAKRVVRLSESDQGRPLSDFAHDLVDGDLVQAAQRVLHDLTSESTEVRCDDGRYLLRRLTPYRSEEGHIGGVVILFVDITERKRLDEQLRASEAKFRAIFEATSAGMTFSDWETGRLLDCNETFARMLGYSHAELQELTYLDFTHPEDREKNSEGISQLIRGELANYETEKRYVRRDGSIFWAHVTGNVVRDRHGQPQYVVGVIIDIDQRRQAQEQLKLLNESLEEQVADRVELMQILQDVAILSNESRTVEGAILAMLERICQYNHWVIGHAYRLIDGPTRRMNSANTWYVHPNLQSNPERVKLLQQFQTWTSDHQPVVGTGLIGRVLETGNIVWLDQPEAFAIGKQATLSQLGLTAAVAFPIRIDGEVVAVAECFADQPITKEKRFMEVLTNVGIQLGHVLERKQLERAIAVSTAEQQRYIGQELHDNVAQDLTGSGMLAESLRLKLEQEKSPHAKDMSILVKYLRECVGNVRRLSHGLMPVVIDSEGLIHALRHLAEQTSELYRIKVLVLGEAEVNVNNNDTATHLYRIAKEAVQNAVKHASPKRVTIELHREGNAVVLVVADNGSGLQPGDSNEGGMGLRIMQYRADLIGGELEVTSQPGGGTVVTCRVQDTPEQPAE